MTVDPIESLAERVLDELLHGDLAKAAALLRAAIEAERAAAVEPFRELLEELRHEAAELDTGAHGSDVSTVATALTIAHVGNRLAQRFTSAPSADELARRVREGAVRELAARWRTHAAALRREARYSVAGEQHRLAEVARVHEECAKELCSLLPEETETKP